MSQDHKMTHRELGTLIGLASMGMLFGTLLLSYLLARTRAPVWPPIGIPAVPFFLPALSTFILLVSSFFVHQSYKVLLEDQKQRFKKLWKLSIWLAFFFLCLQSAVLFQLYKNGVKIQSHLYGSIVYTLIVFHALHILAGIWALTWIAWQFPKYSATNSEGPRLVGWFWHFLDVIWLMMFTLIVWR